MKKQKITIITVKKPKRENINEEIKWLCQAIGLFGARDKDNSLYRIFVEILKNTGKDPQSSDKLAYKLDLTRGTIIPHIKKLKEMGIIHSESNRYELKVDTLEELIDEMQKDLIQSTNEIKKIAKKIDKKLGL